MNKYPYWRVGIVFASCPAVIGLYVALVIVYKTIEINNSVDMEALNAAAVLVPVLMPYAIFIEIVPSAVLSALYLILKLRRGWRSYVFVGFAGGIGSLLWNFFYLHLDFVIWTFIENRKLSEFLSEFVSGAVSSVVAAILILPKRETQVNTGTQAIINYPRKRVLVGLSLSPMVSGIFFFILLTIHAIAMTFDDAMSGKLSIYWPLAFVGAISQSIVMAIFFELAYVVPAFLMSLIVALRKAKREPRGILLVFLGGGLAATLWNAFLIPIYRQGGQIPLMIDELLKPTLFAANINIFYWGAITSSIMALRVLPPKNTKQT